MSATVHPIRPRDVDPEWLTAERLTAYRVAIAIDPEIVLAPVMARVLLVDRICYGLRKACHANDPGDNGAKLKCIDLMRQDAQAAAERRGKGGW